MKEYKLTMEITMLMNEDMQMDSDIKEDLEKGDIQITDIQAKIVDKDGNSLLDVHENSDVLNLIMGGFRGA